MLRKILFIDRDGTLLREPKDKQIDSLDKVHFLSGVIPSLLTLSERGYRFVMVSNQDGLGTSSFPEQNFQLAQNMVMEIFASQGILFDDVLICPHFENECCSCRKPKLGLLDSYLCDRSIDWLNSAVIGDRDTDLEMARKLQIDGFKICQDTEESWTQLVSKIIRKSRSVKFKRKTNETSISLQLTLDGFGRSQINTGLSFFDHMLEQLAKHSSIDLDLKVVGDLNVDDHHTIEDVGIVLGEAFRQTLKDKKGIGRYGFTLPMDECRAEALIDISNRSITRIRLPFTSERVGDIATEMISHFFTSFAMSMGMNLHLEVSEGNNHHIAESAFKATAKALKQAISININGNLPTTKGLL